MYFCKNSTYLCSSIGAISISSKCSFFNSNCSRCLYDSYIFTYLQIKAQVPFNSCCSTSSKRVFQSETKQSEMHDEYNKNCMPFKRKTVQTCLECGWFFEYQKKNKRTVCCYGMSIESYNILCRAGNN